MKLVSRVFALALSTLAVALVACSSSSSESNAGVCKEAGSVTDACSAKPADGGAKATLTMDVAECEKAGDEGKKAAQCVVDHKNNCDCIVKCMMTGTCS